MVTENLNLARREAWRFHRRTDMAYDDLESAAFIGLMKACYRFDHSLGWKFSTFAVPKIRGELLHYVRDHSYLLRLSHRMRENWIKGRKLLDRGSSDIEIAKHLDIPLADWLDTRQACSGAPLELKEGITVFDSSPTLTEDDRLTRLLQCLEKAWLKAGRNYCKNILDHFRFNTELDPRSINSLIDLLDCIYSGRDVCFLEQEVACLSSPPPQHLRSASAELAPDGSIHIEAEDLGGGRVQCSLFDSSDEPS